MRTSVYIDGFNFYYRAVKGTSFKWLDFKKLLTALLPSHHSIQAIKYFTALVSGKGDPDRPIRQSTYLRAIEKHIPELSIHYGHFLSHQVSAPLAHPQGDHRFVRIIKTEEKGSDVNLAVHLLNDAWLDCYDCAVIVSNDSDLAEAIKIVKDQRKKSIGLILPGRVHPSKTLMAFADFIKHVRPGALASSQLPNPIPGTTIHKPSTW